MLLHTSFLPASHIDELHTTTDAEENCQLSELKTEIEGSVEPEIQEPESERNVDDSEDDAQDCLVVDEECDAEDGHGHLSPPKTEEEDGERDEEQEQFGTLPLLISDLQHNSIPLPNNSTSSDCSMFVMLEGNTNVSTTDLNDQYSDLAGRASGPSNSKKQKGPRYICNICGKSLSSKYSLTVHFTIRELQQSIHSPKCQFICNICGKSLSTKQGLSYHITMHTGERPYTCTWCGKSFVQKHNLKIHQNIHTGAKPYACTLCPKSFADPSSLKKHKRILHTGEKPFACTQCGKRFAKKFNLDIHYNIHSGARPYVCTLCPRSFADPSAFGRHKIMHRKKSHQSKVKPSH
uniref:C2H2-type domain-containing protein n=1 Tax=Pygocentrus nattereri TaxID=42514 RepID=A0AAR2KWZ2_PYGNA